MRITTIGEILLDMTQTRVENGIPHFAANPGGAPANVAVVGARLGVETAFIGCVRFANKAASITTSRPGAIPAMPTLKEVQEAL